MGFANLRGRLSSFAPHLGKSALRPARTFSPPGQLDGAPDAPALLLGAKVWHEHSEVACDLRASNVTHQ
jgi:hypothetical protein